MRRHCEIIEDLLPLYVDQVINTGTEMFVTDHLSECERCRQMKAELLQNKSYTLNMVQKAPTEPSPDEMEFIEQIQRSKRWSSAVFLLLILVFSLIYWLVFDITPLAQSDQAELQPSFIWKGLHLDLFG